MYATRFFVVSSAPPPIDCAMRVECKRDGDNHWYFIVFLYALTGKLTTPKMFRPDAARSLPVRVFAGLHIFSCAVSLPVRVLYRF